MECNHDINSKDTTIKVDTKRFCAAFPRKYKGVCPICGKSFVFLKENGIYNQTEN